MPSAAPVPVTIAIDVEPDARMIARHESGPWRGFERFAETLSRLRSSLPGKNGGAATFTWLLRMDPQIRLSYGDTAYVARRYRRILDEFVRAGDDIGIHTHLYDWDHGQQRWVTDMERPQWARTCVGEGLDTYQQLFSTPCRTHSFGDRYMSEDVLDQLEDGGVRCDLTPESGLGAVDQGFPNELHRGLIPDMRDAPRSVWRPARGSMMRHEPASGRQLVFMPISTYRFPRLFEAGRRIDMLRRRRRGRPGSMDERVQRYVRLCLEHRPYVLRYGLRQLEREFAPGHLQFVLNTAQANDTATLGRYCAGIEYLRSDAAGRRYEFMSAMQSVAESA